MVRLYFIIFYFIILLRQIIAFENLFQNVGTWDGLVSPQIVNATIGEDVFLKIIDSPTNLKDCLFRKSGQTDSRPPRDKYIAQNEKKKHRFGELISFEFFFFFFFLIQCGKVVKPIMWYTYKKDQKIRWWCMAIDS